MRILTLQRMKKRRQSQCYHLEKYKIRRVSVLEKKIDAIYRKLDIKSSNSNEEQRFEASIGVLHSLAG